MLAAETSQLGKEHDRWFARLRPTVKDKPSYVVRVKNNCLWKTGGCLWTLSNAVM